MESLLHNIREARIVLPCIDTLDRIGISGRARAWRHAAQSLIDALSEGQKEALKALLSNNPGLGLSQLAWLRGMPNSTSTASLHALLERLTGQLFTRSRRKQDQTWQASQSKVGRLMRLFSSTLGSLQQAHENGSDSFEALDWTVSWERLMKVKPEVGALGDMATEDPLTLASRRYVQLRKFAPAFIEAFSFSVPEAGTDLQKSLALLREHNKSGKRKLPDKVPTPFPAKHWKALIMEDGKPNRRSYETAVIAALRDRLRAGDAWVEGSCDYRRFDAYLMTKPEAAKVLGPTGLPTDGKEWLKDRSALLNDRLSDVQTKLEAGKLEGVRLDGGRLKITPHDPVTPAAGEQLDRAIDAVMPRIRITDLLWNINQQTGF